MSSTKQMTMARFLGSGIDVVVYRVAGFIRYLQ
jgi:hypothetical protein